MHLHLCVLSYVTIVGHFHLKEFKLKLPLLKLVKLNKTVYQTVKGSVKQMHSKCRIQ